eukprot:5753251-Pyramimonas_sp.AAC.1
MPSYGAGGPRIRVRSLINLNWLMSAIPRGCPAGHRTALPTRARAGAPMGPPLSSRTSFLALHCTKRLKSCSNCLTSCARRDGANLIIGPSNTT